MANLQKSAKGLKNIRKGYDELLKEYGGKRPTTYSKLRQFTDALLELIEAETLGGGFGPVQQPRIKGLTIEAPAANEDLAQSDSGVGEDFSGKKILPLSKPKKSKAEVERDKRKAGVKPVFIPKQKEPNPEEEELKAKAEAIAKKAKEDAEKEAKEIEMAAAAKMAEDQKSGTVSRGVTLREDEGKDAKAEAGKKKKAS